MRSWSPPDVSRSSSIHPHGDFNSSSQEGSATPGIVGLCERGLTADAAGNLLERMSGALEADGRFVRAAYHEAGFGFARVGLDGFGSGANVVWNRDRTRAVLLEGELYDTAPLRKQLGDADAPVVESDHAGLLLALIERFGTGMVERLNGAFVAAVWETRERRLVVFNDRFGLLPCYYASVPGGVVFGSGVRALLAHPDLDRSTDLVAIHQFLLHDHALDDRTLFEAVKLLPQGSMLTVAEGQLSIRPYWTLRYPEFYEPRPEAHYVEGLLEHLRGAVARQRPGGQPAAMLLSGGLDSRLLLALLLEEGTPIEALTFGIPGCEDAKVAEEVAGSLHARYRFFELKPDWLLERADEAVRLTDGLGNIVNLHALATLEAETAHARVLYKGFAGDALLGFAIKPEMWGDYRPEVQPDVHRGVHTQQGTLIYQRPQEAALLSDDFRARVGDAAFRAYADGMARAGVRQLANQRLYFDMTQRVPRMTLNGVEVTRSRAIVRLPFCDNELVDFILTIPPGFLFERRLQKTLLGRHFRKLAQIPIAGSGRPLVACARDLAVQARELAAWHLGRVGLERLAARAPRPYKDYNGWFRGVLRSWVEELLFSRRATERGYFRPEGVRQLWDEHLAGTNHAVRIGALLTLELWHRQFVD